MCSCQAQTSWGRKTVLGLMCPMLGDAVPLPRPKLHVLLLQPGRTESSSGSTAQVCPWQRAVRSFQHCHHKLLSNSWQLGSNAAREAVLHAGIAETGESCMRFRQSSAKTELGATRQELVLPSIRMVSFCLFWCHSVLSPVCARPGHDLNWPSGLKRKDMNKAATKPAAKPPCPPSPSPAWSRGGQVEKQHLPPAPRGALGQQQNRRQQGGMPWEVGISPSST